MARTDTKVVTAHIPFPLIEKVDFLASRLDRPRSWIVKQALAAWVEQEERNQLERSASAREALVDGDAECVVNPPSRAGAHR